MRKNTFIPAMIMTAALIFGLALTAQAAKYQYPRTVDMLTEEELIKLDELEKAYFSGIRDEALTLVKIRFDLHTILRTFPEQVRVIRQRRRGELMTVERYLYSLKLNPEFIQSYVERLRDDVLHYALDQMIKKSDSMGGPRR